LRLRKSGIAFSKLGSAKFGKSQNGKEQGFTPLFWLLDVGGGGVLLSSPGTDGTSSTGDS